MKNKRRIILILILALPFAFAVLGLLLALQPFEPPFAPRVARERKEELCARVRRRGIKDYSFARRLVGGSYFRRSSSSGA